MLPAIGNTTIEGKLKNGKVEGLKVTPYSGMEDIVILDI